MQPAKGKSAIIQDGLQINLAYALERADEERVDGHQLAYVMHFDLALAKLRAEAFEQADLFVVKFQRVIALLTFQPQQSVVLGEQVVTAPYATRRLS